MKKLFTKINVLALLMALPFLASAGKHTITYINSNPAFEGSEVAIIDITDNKSDTIGKVEFRNKKISFQRSYEAMNQKAVVLMMFAKPGASSTPKVFLPLGKEDITIEESATGKIFTGSEIARDYGTMLTTIADIEKKGTGIQEEFELASQANDAVKATEIEKRSNTLRSDYFKSISGFASKHKDHPMASFILSSVLEVLSGYEDENAVYQLAMAIEKVQPQSLWAQGMAKTAKSKMALSTGSSATDFMLKSLQGKEVKLSDFKGKYVLIDFWASWCGPCRREIPNLKKAYAKYGGKDFEILGVSIDQDAQKWKNAIKEDNTLWTHVLDDGKGEQRPSFIYRVESIPRTFLLDREGKIIAANLRGQALVDKLDQIFKK